MLPQYRAPCTCCLIPSTLNEKLISNAWDLRQNGLAIVDSAEEAGLLAGRQERLQRWREAGEEGGDGEAEARGEALGDEGGRK